MNETLESLLLDLSSLSDQEAEDLVFQQYSETYLTTETNKGLVGNLLAHDNDKVVFYEERYDHAFFTSINKTTRQYNKGQFDRIRGERVHWIGEIIQGNIKTAECYHIPQPNRRDSSGRTLVQRLYVLWEDYYLIWLEPRHSGGWWFSTAFRAHGREYIKNIIRRGLRKNISRD